MKPKTFLLFTLLVAGLSMSLAPLAAQVPAVPPKELLNRSFGDHDKEAFMAPEKVFYPETWFHYIGGNVSKEGITADLEAIAAANFSGVQMFHGQFGGPWPGVDPQITCLSPLWEEALKHTAEECRRLGLRFTMQNCPGWAMSGGPWIEPSNAMRHLAWSRTDLTGGSGSVNKTLPIPQPSEEEWRDYRDIAVLAFPTPLDDTGEPLRPRSVTGSMEGDWEACFLGRAEKPFRFAPSTEEAPHWVEVTFPDKVIVRTFEFPSVNSLNHGRCYEPGVTVKVDAVMPDGHIQNLVDAELPQSSWQDDYPISFACPETKGTAKYRISIVNKYDMELGSLRMFTAARKNSWESEAGWTLRSIERTGEHVEHSRNAYVDPLKILDITSKMDTDGNLKWDTPEGNWTVLRIGHINTGRYNQPAPPEGTGWECNKLSESGPDVQFANYIGRLSSAEGPLRDGLLNGMLMDSWECKTQTWTDDMEVQFQRVADYPLRKWLPALFGYVLTDQQTTSRFLLDWRATLGDLYSNKFYGRMAALAKANRLSVTYETSSGDILPVDILEYFKHADVPMCEFWQPYTPTEGFVGSLNFKPIKPTASAARIYGKPRVAAEAFTSFSLTWDEHWSMLKEVANINSVEGVTHMVFHTYTHNPRTDFLPPGTSFGSAIGTPFLRGQTWWKHMPLFNDYLARCSYMLERGVPVSDVLWYLGDEINHKPDQNAAFPAGFKYDYCNPDVLLHRLTVKDGTLFTPEGIGYKVLWIPDSPRMLPQTLEKLYDLVNEGATIIGNPPLEPATLTGGKTAQRRFDTAVKNIWGKTTAKGIRKVGKGRVVSGTPLPEALKELKMTPDVTGSDALWVHRKTDGADLYYVCAPQGKGFNGELDFNNTGNVELWDPVAGFTTAIPSRSDGNRTSVKIDLPEAGSCFIVFRHDQKEAPKFAAQRESVASVALTEPWNLKFPEGWGAPVSVSIPALKAWKDLDISPEGKAFSGTVVYNTTFDINENETGLHFILDLGDVEMIAAVAVNGRPLRTLWAKPYRVDITDAVRTGENILTVEVTGTWFNRLVYDAGQPEAERKTWVISGPSKDAELRNSGLMGPVTIIMEK